MERVARCRECRAFDGSLPVGKGALHGTRTAVHGTRNWGSIGLHRWVGSTAGCDWGETCDRLRMAPIR